MLLQKLVSDGNFKHNISVVQDGEGKTVIARRSMVDVALKSAATEEYPTSNSICLTCAMTSVHGLCIVTRNFQLGDKDKVFSRTCACSVLQLFGFVSYSVEEYFSGKLLTTANGKKDCQQARSLPNRAEGTYKSVISECGSN